MNGSDVADTLTYGRKLVHAGLNGIRSAGPAALNGRPLSEVALESAATVVPLAAAGASLALLGSYLMRKRGRAANVWIYGAVGTAIGMFVGVSWNARKIAPSLAHSAMKEVHKASDEHWLETHPIDYA